MGLILRGNIGRRVSELETDNNFIYLNGLLGLTSDINFATNGGGGITHSFANGLLFGSGDSPPTLIINSISNQSCNTETGVLTATVNVTIQNPVGNVYLQAELQVGNFLVWQNITTLNNGNNTLDISPVEGTSGIQFRLRDDMSGDAFSETYTTDIVACESDYYFELNEILVAGEEALFIVSCYVNYNNSNLRTFILERYNKTGWISVGDFQPPNPPDQPIIRNDSVLFQLDYDLLIDGSEYRIVGRDGNYEQLRTNGVVYTKPSTILTLNSLAPGQGSSVVYWSSVNAWPVGYFKGRPEFSILECNTENGEYVQIQTWQPIIPNPPPINETTGISQINGYVPNPGYFYKIGCKDAPDGNLVLSNAYQYLPTYVTINSYDNDVLSYTYGNTFDVNGDYNWIFLEKLSDSGLWEVLTTIDIGRGATVYGGSSLNWIGEDVEPGEDLSVYRLYTYNSDGVIVYSNQVEYGVYVSRTSVTLNSLTHLQLNGATVDVDFVEAYLVDNQLAIAFYIQRSLDNLEWEDVNNFDPRQYTGVTIPYTGNLLMGITVHDGYWYRYKVMDIDHTVIYSNSIQYTSVVTNPSIVLDSVTYNPGSTPSTTYQFTISDYTSPGGTDSLTIQYYDGISWQQISYYSPGTFTNGVNTKEVFGNPSGTRNVRVWLHVDPYPSPSQEYYTNELTVMWP